MRDGQPLSIGRRGAALLDVLLGANGHVVDKATLLDRGWPGMIVEEGNLSVQIASLRKALGARQDGQDWITTVPRVGYRLFKTPMIEGRPHDPASPLPSLAVLPFQNLSSDPEQDYFADGIAEDITTALSRFKSFAVIARNSSFAYKGRSVDVRQVASELGVRYVLEGSVRRAGANLRVTTQLVDGETGLHLWAQNFDGALTDIFAVQDGITERVAGIIEPKITKAEVQRTRLKPPQSLDAYDLNLRGWQKFISVKEHDNAEAYDLFTRAVDLDPSYAEPFRGAFAVLELRIAMGWPSLTGNDHQACQEHVARALDLAGGDANIIAHAGVALTKVARQYQRGLELIEIAVRLNPNSQMVMICANSAHVACGDLEKSLAYGLRALDFNPTDIGAHWPMTGIAHFYMITESFSEACRWAERSHAVNPDFDAAYWMLIAANAKMGRMDDAEPWLDRFRELRPMASVASIRAAMPGRYPERDANILDGLRIAGLAEI